MKAILLTVLGLSYLIAGLNIEPVAVEHDGKKVTIQRENLGECKEVKVTPPTIWGGQHVNEKVPAVCKKSFATTVGKIQPMQVAEGVETVGELEVLAFLRNGEGLLIDARGSDWLEYGTIPGAVNIPHDDLEYDPILEADYLKTLEKLGIKKDKDVYSFKEAKSLIVFCNGPWCPQSGWFVHNLINLGYRKDKIKWYRGGMTAWSEMGLTVVK